MLELIKKIFAAIFGLKDVPQDEDSPTIAAPPSTVTLEDLDIPEDLIIPEQSIPEETESPTVDYSTEDLYLTPQFPPFTYEQYTAMRLLKMGDRGTDVKLLQKGLALYTRAKTNIGSFDGSFGPATQTALIQYQKENNIPTTGVFDNSTQARLVPLIDKAFITLEKIDSLAKRYGIEPAALKAVYDVESRGDGFLSSGRCVILFEGHIFYRLYAERFGKAQANAQASRYPTIVYPTWTSKFYKGGDGEHTRLNTAMQINKEMAYMSASWGLFQIMGFNHRAAGYPTPVAFVNAMVTSEIDQFLAGCNFIRSDANMFNSLKRHDWKDFARRYNGPGYAQNKYDVKLAQAYNKYR